MSQPSNLGQSTRPYEDVIASQLSPLAAPTVCLQGVGKTLGETVVALLRLEKAGIAERVERRMRAQGTWWRRGPKWAGAQGQNKEATNAR